MSIPAGYLWTSSRRRCSSSSSPTSTTSSTASSARRTTAPWRRTSAAPRVGPFAARRREKAPVTRFALGPQLESRRRIHTLRISSSVLNKDCLRVRAHIVARATQNALGSTKQLSLQRNFQLGRLRLVSTLQNGAALDSSIIRYSQQTSRNTASRVSGDSAPYPASRSATAVYRGRGDVIKFGELNHSQQYQ